MADWSRQENELIVSVYFEMLHLELTGKSYNKAAFRRGLIPLLQNRSNGSVEKKHQNISGVLTDLGVPYIIGYAPLRKYQIDLREVVIEHLKINGQLEKDFDEFAEESVEVPKKVDFKNWKELPPVKKVRTKPLQKKSFKPFKRNYLEIEQKNISHGESGEQLVYDYEIWRLKKLSAALAREVKWISRDEGDGAGYDILSKDNKGANIFIEVKTTKLGKEAPIFFTRTEKEFSNQNSSSFHLYRVFDLKMSPKLFIKKGSLDNICFYEPVSFKGYFH